MSEKQARRPEWIRETPQYVEVADQVSKAQEAARTAVAVTDETTCGQAAELLSKVAKVVKYGDKKRLDTSQPYRDSTDAINAEFKELTAPLSGVEARLREEVETFETKRREAEEEAQRKHEEEVRKAEEAQCKAEEEAEKARLAAEQARKEAEEKEEPVPEPPPPPPAPEPAPPPPPPPPAPRAGVSRKTSTGSVGTRTEWKHEVVDFAAVPDDLKSFNQAEATRRVRAGEREIPGLRIYPVERAHVR